MGQSVAKFTHVINAQRLTVVASATKRQGSIEEYDIV
jgi:hypothetical protein